MGGFVAARLAAAHPERVRRLVLCDGGVPLTVPAGSTPEDDLPGRIPLSWGRLGRAFADRRRYAAYWRSDPATDGSWSDEVEAALTADLGQGPDGRWRAAVSLEAVVADGVGLYDPAGELLRDRQPTSFPGAAGCTTRRLASGRGRRRGHVASLGARGPGRDAAGPRRPLPRTLPVSGLSGSKTRQITSRPPVVHPSWVGG